MLECLAKVNIPEPKRNKICQKIIDTIFVRYSLDSNTCKIHEISNDTMIESRDATFFKSIFPFESRILLNILLSLVRFLPVVL